MMFGWESSCRCLSSRTASGARPSVYSFCFLIFLMATSWEGSAREWPRLTMA